MGTAPYVHRAVSLHIGLFDQPACRVESYCVRVAGTCTQSESHNRRATVEKPLPGLSRLCIKYQTIHSATLVVDSDVVQKSAMSWS